MDQAETAQQSLGQIGCASCSVGGNGALGTLWQAAFRSIGQHPSLIIRDLLWDIILYYFYCRVDHVQEPPSADFWKAAIQIISEILCLMLTYSCLAGKCFRVVSGESILLFRYSPCSRRVLFPSIVRNLNTKCISHAATLFLMQLITLSRLPRFTAAASRVLGLSLVMTLLNQFWLEPTSTKIMFSRYALENNDDPNVKDSSEYKKLAASFGKLHGISSLTNLIALVGSAVHGVYLASAMVGAL